MNNLRIAPSQESPTITFSTDGHFKIEGISLVPNVHSFYKPVFDWLDEFEKNLPPKIIVELEFEYLNTASIHTVVTIIKRLVSYTEKNVELKVIWCYAAEDDDLLENGQNFMNYVNFPFEFQAR
jgi:SiaC family regulatory phosphoprotein